MADYDQRVGRLDSQSKALLGQVRNLNEQIAAQQVAAAPPARAWFSSGAGTVKGGASCGNHFSYVYCTWYRANRRCVPWFGNAWEQYGQAQAYGYAVGQQARVGAVVVWNQSRGGGYGHVGYVESVQGNGLTVSEVNYNAWGQVDYRFVSYSNPGPLTGFIYARRGPAG